MRRIRLTGLLALGLGWGGCAGNPEPAPRAQAAPDAMQRYAALADTAVCVVDRTTSRGLRNLDAKREADGRVVLLVDGEIRPLEELHPVGVVAGYAGREAWVTGGRAIDVQGRRYVPVGGERRVPMEQIQRMDEYQAIPLYADPKETRPARALYAPLRPGCVFQAYVREDLVSG